MDKVTEQDIWVRSTDLDADGIVNNARHFEFFEQSRLEHMRRLGIIKPRDAANAHAPRGRTFTIAETTCRYRRPLRHRDWITVRCWTSEIRNRSFIFAYDIVLRNGGDLVAEGSSAQVWLDANGRPTPMSPEIRRLLEESLPTGVPAA